MNPPEKHNNQLYVVSISKLIIMSASSMGLYLVYWSYRHWLLIRGQRGLKLFPLLCAIFSALTMYSLMKKIIARCHEVKQPVEGTALGVTLMYWLPSLIIFGWDLGFDEHMANSLPLSVFIVISLMLPIIRITFIIVALVQMQQAANICEGDPHGLQNSKITWTNVMWLIICWIPFAALFGFLVTNPFLLY